MFISSTMSEEVDFSSLNTVGTFDDGEGSPGVFGDEVLQDYKVHYALVEMLVSQFCAILEKDNKRRRKLYLRLCKLLNDVGFVSPYYAVDGFEFVRNYFKESFFVMVKEALASLDGMPIQAQFKLELSKFQHTVPDTFQYQRYSNDFDEISLIDRGGFGAVYKSRNKLDGETYAVKKIYLSYQDILYFLKAVKEVRLLAKLKHPNIVSYKSSWVEPVTTNSRVPANNMSKDSAGDDSMEIDFEITSDEELRSIASLEPFGKYLSSIVSSEDKSDSKEATSESSVNYSSINNQERTDSEDISFQNSVSRSSREVEDSEETATTSSANNNIVDAKCKGQNNFPIIKEQAILYVQMELCQQTLRQWLDARNERNEIDVYSCFNIFTQVVKSVEYIHSQGIVHHDLKPSNIFVSRDLKCVQVGDFGLACNLVVHNNGGPLSVIPLTEHADVGTKLYAAPEQLRGICHQKSDIYSLGIILLELMRPFRTSMERSKAIEELKKGSMSPSLTIPFVGRILRYTMLTNLNKRPSSKELLAMIEEFELSNSDMVLVEREELHRLRSEIDTLKNEVERLKKKQKVNHNLT